MELKTMDGCKRCPTCHTSPEMTLEDKVLSQVGQDVVLRCESHGHVAMGDTLEMAVINWNKYISFVVMESARHYMEVGAGKIDESYCTVCGDYSKTEEFPDRSECANCHAVKAWKPEQKKRAAGGGLMAALLGLVMLAMPIQAATLAPADIQTYADNAIMNAAEHGYHKVTLVFGHANPGDIEDLAQELRDRGYRIDEEAQLLNPMIIKVQYLKASAMASIKKTEVTQ